METERLHTNLVPAAAADLEAEKTASQMNRADVVNRALRLYHFLMEEKRGGREICVRDKKTGNVEPVKMTPLVKTVITIQPGNSPDGTYDVRWPMPYPFHVDAETGDVGYQDLWKGDPFRVVGFQKEVDVQKVDLHWHDAAADPQKIVGMFPVMLGTNGEEPKMYNLDTPITDVSVQEIESE